MAPDVPPGLQRHGRRPPTRWRGFDQAAWDALVDEAQARETAGRAALRRAFHGSDAVPHAIRSARENAAVARVGEAVSLHVGDIADLAPLANPRGLVASNPPYDARLAADPALYRALGNALKRATPQWRASLLCGDPELAYATGLRRAKKYQVFNGAIVWTLIVCDSAG